jgi:hypothetical protein
MMREEHILLPHYPFPSFLLSARPPKMEKYPFQDRIFARKKIEQEREITPVLDIKKRNTTMKTP